jgi:hypothetical protein
MEINRGELDYVVYNNFSYGGLNTNDDPEVIKDNELTEATNVVYDNSLITNRSGSSKFADSPDTSSPLKRILTLTASDKKEFLLTVVGNSIYLYDPLNNFFLKLNQTFNLTPGLDFNGVVWFAGYSNDRFYGGNISDTPVRWYLTLNYVVSNLNGTETSIPLQDASRFPAGGGKIVIRDSQTGTAYTRDYTSISGNNLVLASGQTAPAVKANSAVSMCATQVSGMPSGEIWVVNQRRLFIANSQNNETKINYSQINNPENFGGTGIVAGGFEYIADGEGGITNIIDLVDYLLITKRDVFQKFEFIINSSLDSKLVSIRPIISGKGIGVINNKSTVKIYNSIYGITPDGFITRIDGIATGGNTSLAFNILSTKINNFLKNFDLEQTRAIYFDKKILFSVKTKNIDTPSGVIVYDVLRNSFSFFTGWSVNDLTVYNNKLLFASDKSINVAFDENDYSDNGINYESRIKTKRFSFGDVAFPKQCDKILISGYISKTTKLKVRLLYNDSGKLGVFEKEISGKGDYVNYDIGGSPLWGEEVWGVLPFGWGSGKNKDIGFFRVYIDLPLSFGFINIQVEISSSGFNDKWAIQNIGFSPKVVKSIPKHLVI